MTPNHGYSSAGGVDPLKAPAPAQPAPPLVPGILGKS